MEMELKVTKKKAVSTKQKEPAETLTKQHYYTYEDYPIEDLLVYGGIDCIVTSGLLGRLSSRIFEKPHYTWIDGNKKTDVELMSIAESYQKYTTEAHEFILDLEMNGIKYDIEKNKVFKARLQTEIAGLETQIFSHIPPMNLDSGQQLAECLYGTREFKVESRTKTGEPSTDGDAIKALAIAYPEAKVWLELLAKRNDLASIYRTFVETYVEKFVKRDGRVHASYSLHGTGSFRIAGDSPNLTQLPRSKWGYNLRELFTVDKGNVFICFDFSSAEVKILGAICKDPNLMRSISEGLDFHSFSASNMFEIPYEQFITELNYHGDNPDLKKLRIFRKEQRQICKILTFSIIYGSSPAGIAGQLGVTKERAEQLIGLYFRLYPGIEIYIKETHAMAKLNHYVFTPFGQRKMEYGVMDPFIGTAVYNGCLRGSQNFKIQSTSSTFGMMCFAALNKAIKPLGAKSTCSIYDSIEIEAPLSVAAEVVELAFYYMNDWPIKEFDWLGLYVGCDGELGPNFGEVTHVDRGITQAQIEEMYKTW
jgi:DNA polymerase-1